MTPAQRQMIKEAYQEGYNEAAQLSEEELEEAIPAALAGALGLGAAVLRRPVVNRLLGALGAGDLGKMTAEYLRDNPDPIGDAGKSATPTGPFPGGDRPF